MKIHFFLPVAAVLSLAGVSPVAKADCGPRDDICTTESLWAFAHEATVEVGLPQGGALERWEFTVPEDGDMLIEAGTQAVDPSTREAIMLVSGRAILTKGMVLKQGFEVDALDGPVLMYQLMANLLAQAIPDGPEQFQGERTIELQEAKRSIRVHTESAIALFQPPWVLKGIVARKDASTVAFTFSFTFSGEAGQQSMLVNGLWSKQNNAPIFDDSTNIEGWTLYWLGGITTETQNGVTFDYGASSKPLSVKTLGELREQIEQEAGSGR